MKFMACSVTHQEAAMTATNITVRLMRKTIVTVPTRSPSFNLRKRQIVARPLELRDIAVHDVRKAMH